MRACSAVTLVPYRNLTLRWTRTDPDNGAAVPASGDKPHQGRPLRRRGYRIHDLRCREVEPLIVRWSRSLLLRRRLDHRLTPRQASAEPFDCRDTHRPSRQSARAAPTNLSAPSVRAALSKLAIFSVSGAHVPGDLALNWTTIANSRSLACRPILRLPSR